MEPQKEIEDGAGAGIASQWANGPSTQVRGELCGARA